ncbi:MAG: hypothetical protein ACI8PZ_002570 [Myxococcota bacterium]|jgi:hypothetical protein
MSSSALLSMPSGTLVSPPLSAAPALAPPIRADRADADRIAIARSTSVVAAIAGYLVLSPLVATIAGLALIVTVLWGTELRRTHGQAGRWHGLGAGTLTGLGGTLAVAPIDASFGSIAALQAMALGFIAVPAALALGAPRQLGVRAGWLGLGALTWLASMPWVVAAGSLGVAVGGEIGGAVGVALAAGTFEELARAAAFWRTRPTDREALVHGIGHGGLEAVFYGLQAVGVALWLGPGLWMPSLTLFALGASRVVLLGVHVGLSIRVARAIRAGSASALAAVIALHVALDLAALVAPLLWITWGSTVSGLSLPIAAAITAPWVWSTLHHR